MLKIGDKFTISKDVKLDTIYEILKNRTGTDNYNWAQAIWRQCGIENEVEDVQTRILYRRQFRVVCPKIKMGYIIPEFLIEMFNKKSQEINIF